MKKSVNFIAQIGFLNMKGILVLVFCFSGFVASAQNGFYLQPEIGIGSSNVSAHDNMILGRYENEGRYSIGVLDCELGIGYRIGHLEINSGIFFLQSGFYEHTLSGYMFMTDTKTTQYYNHIALPVIADFRIRPGKRFSIAPGIGYEISHNYSDNKTTDQDGVVTKQKLTGAAFTNLYQVTSAWWIIRLGAGYKLNKRMGIVAGVELHDMLTSILAEGYNPAAFQYSVILSLNAGITWNFGKK